MRLYPGTGSMTVNGRSFDEYFGAREFYWVLVTQPLEAVGLNGRFDVVAKVVGGGLSGQAGAIRHGIARALLAMSEDLKKPLREGGFLTRDPRVKERKKVGLKRARKAPQYTKR